MSQPSKNNRVFILLLYAAFIVYKTVDAVKAYRQNDDFRLYWSVALVAILTVLFVVLLLRYKKQSDANRNPFQ